MFVQGALRVWFPGAEAGVWGDSVVCPTAQLQAVVESFWTNGHRTQLKEALS